MIFLRSRSWFPKKGARNKESGFWNISCVLLSLYRRILGLLLCTLLVVLEIRPATRARGVLPCVSVMERGSENNADQFVETIAWAKPTILTIVGDIDQTWQARNPSNPNLSINIRLARFQAFFVLFQECDRTSYSWRFSTLFGANTIQHQFKLVRTQHVVLQFRKCRLTAPVTALLPLPLGWTTGRTLTAYNEYWLGKIQSSTAS